MAIDWYLKVSQAVSIMVKVHINSFTALQQNLLHLHVHVYTRTWFSC